MSLVVNQLKGTDPSLVWRSDKEISAVISFLEERGYCWSASRKVFRNENLESVISGRDIGRFINNHQALEKKIEKTKKRGNKKGEYLGDIIIAGKVINFFVFLVIINLFLGWIFLPTPFWVTTEVLFIILLIAFVKMRQKIRSRLKREIYVKPGF